MTKFAITRDGVRVAYQSSGRGAPLVLVHGLGDDRSIWDGIVQRLEPYYTCITLDLRGHGQTTGGTRFGPFDLAHDIEAVISEASLQRPALVGHSLGAFAASTYAPGARRPLRAIVNVDQPLMMEAFAPVVRPYEQALREGRVREVFFDVLGPEGLGPVPAALRERLEATRDNLPAHVVLGVWGPLFEAKLDALLLRVEQALSRIVSPYLSLFGHDVAGHYIEWLRARIPHAQVESYHGLGHFLHLLEPERFCERVRSFVG